MAFPIPDHLPRTATPLDYSTVVLTKISETPTKNFGAETISSWIAELDQGILQTKTLIHERIHAHLPSFEGQLASSRSVLSRMGTLSSQMDSLNDAVNHPNIGLLPHLVKELTTHAFLTQQSSDSSVTYSALSQVFDIVTAFQAFSSSVEEGLLLKAAHAAGLLETSLKELPDLMHKAQLVQSLKNKFRLTQSRLEEQIGDAYSRSVVTSSSEFMVRTSVQVRQTSMAISLAEILASFSPAALTTNLQTLRRDIVTHYVEHAMRQPLSLSISQDPDERGSPVHRIALFPSPPGTEQLTSRLQNLSTILTFCSEHLLSALPESFRISFSQSLSKPIVSAILNDLLNANLPSSLDTLPPFLELLSQSTAFEKTHVLGTINDTRHELVIQSWASSVDAHYERKRRTELLQQCKTLVCTPRPDTSDKQIEVVVHVTPVAQPLQQSSVPTKAEDEVHGASEEHDEFAADEDGWGFDDEVQEEARGEIEPQSPASEAQPNEQPSETPEQDAWGLDDNDDPWNDDPWAEDSSGPVVKDSPLGPSMAPTSSPKVAKVAKGLEKFSSKGKTSVPPSPALEPPPPIVHPPPAPSGIPSLANGRTNGSAAYNVSPIPIPAREFYSISKCAFDILEMVLVSLQEGRELASSGIFGSSPSSSFSPGQLLFQTAPLISDLFRALYPVAFTVALNTSPRHSMRFVNDCRYLSSEIGKVAAGPSLDDDIKAKMKNSAEQLLALSDVCYDENVEQQESELSLLLEKANGFLNTALQDIFDECEMVMVEVLRHVRSTAHDWKLVLHRTKYYSAIGLVIETALAHVLDSVLSISDIPEAESHRLSELCRILNTLEGLFVDETIAEAPSMIAAYVPSWLKYCYLSELLEASLADVSYLFDEGALMDFQIDEVVQLVRALFADTPLRANTIKKFMGGHPAPH